MRKDFKTLSSAKREQKLISIYGGAVRLISGKRTWSLGVLLIVTYALYVYSVNAMFGYPASSTQVSPSGRYVMENVRVGRIFMLGGMGYLRVIDTQEPGRVYRTPLYDTQSLDMRAFEDDVEVGITWIDFDKKYKKFKISMPQWKENWLNIFVSNTPYTHLKN